jgi:hypothetical protein
MPLDRTNIEFENDLDAIMRLQDIILQAVEGRRDGDLDKEYRDLRSALLEDPEYRGVVPKFVSRYRDLGSLWPVLKSFSPQWEPRRVEVRRQFEPALQAAELFEMFGSNGSRSTDYDSTAWTGATRPADRIIAVKTLIPVALPSIDQLISSLEAPRHNGGPPLDGTADAIHNLRLLHKVLGNLLTAADEGRLFDATNNDLGAEVARYAKRAARALRDDPIPYAMSGLLLGTLTACGFPGIGGFLSGVAGNIKRS